MKTTSAPGKIILFGEHAVVYGQPAIALPVHAVQAHATVIPAPNHTTTLHLPDLDQTLTPNQEDALSHALLYAINLVEVHVDVPLPPVQITVNSTIPIASGLGSGAATAAALIRALLQYHAPDQADADLVNKLTYEVEKLHHGTPSGIDNTVICYEKPLFFVRGEHGSETDTLRLLSSTSTADLPLIIVDTGIRSETKAVVADVRRQWQANRARFDRLFAACGEIAADAVTALETHDLVKLGDLMTRNHTLLQQMTVSSPELDVLVGAALSAGALGAKLSGGGRGGNMIALVRDQSDEAMRPVINALKQTGKVSRLIVIFGKKKARG